SSNESNGCLSITAWRVEQQVEVLPRIGVDDQLFEEREAIPEDRVDHDDEAAVKPLLVESNVRLPVVPARVLGVEERRLRRKPYGRIRCVGNAIGFPARTFAAPDLISFARSIFVLHSLSFGFGGELLVLRR